MQYKYI